MWVGECDYGECEYGESNYGECDYGEYDIAILYTAGKAGARIYFVYYYQKPKSLVVWVMNVTTANYGECDMV